MRATDASSRVFGQTITDLDTSAISACALRGTLSYMLVDCARFCGHESYESNQEVNA